MVTSERNYRFARTLGVAGALGCTLFVTSASADEKGYHAAFCKPYRTWNYPSSVWTDDSPYVEYYANHIGSRNGSATVLCPCIRDRTNSSTQVDSVTVEGRNGGGTFRCTIYTQNEDTSGATFDSDTDDTSTSGYFQLTMGGSSLSTTTGANSSEGTYVIECEMPEDSELYHYYVREEDSAD